MDIYLIIGLGCVTKRLKSFLRKFFGRVGDLDLTKQCEVLVFNVTLLSGA